MATLFRCPHYEGCDVTMALPKGRSVAAAGCAAITGAGVALGFTVLDSTTSTWLLILATAIPLGVSPVVAGWLSPELKQAWFFPIGVLASLSVATAIYGPLSSDSEPIGFVIVLTLIYGGGASVAFCVAWIARQYLRRSRGHRMPVSHPGHSVAGGCLLLDSPHCALHRYTACFIDFNASAVLVCHPGTDWIDRGRCGVRDHLE